ncbi:hypothetical protein AB0E96_04080 [Kitasatospora sp. NPDC036755]|uniref:hypothetical protein n=1 Tax=Kitasatospora sp. NPDC036755 TaxID=3154600 RepID=UPI0033F62530
MTLSRPAAAVEPPPPRFVVSVDDATMTPGQISSVNVTFTNRESEPVRFVYVMLREFKAEFLGCTGASWCSFSQDNTGTEVFNLAAPLVPILPGESRTVRLPFRFRADLDCVSQWTATFRVWYSYYEFGQGQTAEVFDPPESIAHSTLVCPAA